MGLALVQLLRPSFHHDMVGVEGLSPATGG
jgi:hypothetical protein